MGDTAKLQDKRSPEVIWKSFSAGGFAGMCSKTTVAPLDRIKILLQGQNTDYKHQGVYSSLLNVCRREGILALYKGNGAQMVRVFPYAAVQFASYEAYSPVLTNLMGPNCKDLSKLVSGAISGATAVCLTYPLDMIRARLAFQISGSHVYTGILHAMSSIYLKEGGLRAMYRGFAPTLLGIIPYAGLSFYCFEKIKRLCISYAPAISTEDLGGGRRALTVPCKLMAGGIAGAIAQMASYPLDVTRRRMQLSMMSKETERFGQNCFRTMALIYRENGVVRGLYRGMTINYYRAVPMVSVSFCVYELSKQALGLDTGIRD